MAEYEHYWATRPWNERNWYDSGRKSWKEYKRLYWKKIRAGVRDQLRKGIEPWPTRPRNSIKWDWW